MQFGFAILVFISDNFIFSKNFRAIVKYCMGLHLLLLLACVVKVSMRLCLVAGGFPGAGGRTSVTQCSAEVARPFQAAASGIVFLHKSVLCVGFFKLLFC